MTQQMPQIKEVVQGGDFTIVAEANFPNNSWNLVYKFPRRKEEKKGGEKIVTYSAGHPLSVKLRLTHLLACAVASQVAAVGAA